MSVVLHWTLSSCAAYPLYWETQHWTQHSRCGLSRAEKRGRFFSLKLLAMLFLMQPRVLLATFTPKIHCFLVYFCQSESLAPSLQICFPDGWSSACNGTWDSSSTDAEHCISLSWTAQNSSMPISPTYRGLSKHQHTWLMYQPLLPLLYHSQTCWGCTMPGHNF